MLQRRESGAKRLNEDKAMQSFVTSELAEFNVGFIAS